MSYINKLSLEYPVTEPMIRLSYPNTSFPVPFVAPEGYALVFPSPQPAHDAVTQHVRELAPVLTVKGHYEQQWEIVELFPTQVEKDAAIAADIEAKRKASVPASVTRRQAKQALLLNGLLANVQPAIDAIPDAAQRAMIQIEWDDSQEFERDRPALIALGSALGLTGVQLDSLFIEAAQL